MLSQMRLSYACGTGILVPGRSIRDMAKANPGLRGLCCSVVTPERNPQEHVRSAVRRLVSHSHAIPTLAELANGFK